MRAYISLFLIVMIFIGCCTREVKKDETVAPVVKDQPAQPTPQPQVSGRCCDPCNLVELTPSVPREATLDQNFETNLSVRGLNDADNVMVIARVPQGATFVSSEPSPTSTEGNKLMWNLDSLNKDQVKTIRVIYRADQGGDLLCCFALAALPRWCQSVFVGKPALEITKSGPATAQLGEEFNYSITVTNKGTSIARNVRVSDTVPEGLQAVSEVNFTAGDMQPGESKSFQVRVRATQRGTFVNTARADSDNAGSVTANATTIVQQHSLTVNVTCEKEVFIGKQAKAGVIISNPGDTNLTNVVVTFEWPKELRILSADCLQNVAADQTSASWNIGNIEPNGEKKCEVAMISKYAGEHCFKVTVSTAEMQPKTESCCTMWKGLPALLIEVVDDPDPLLIDEETTYSIRITNQGTAVDKNITIKVAFPEQLDAVSGVGDTQATVETKTVTFAPYPILEPKQAIQWKVKGKAVAKGDARLKVYLTSELLQNAVTEEEPTQVY